MSGGRRFHRLIAIALALCGAGGAAATLAVPASAPAAAGSTIRLTQGCYQTAQKAGVRGSGFDPLSRWRATLDGASFGTGKTNAVGGFTATFGVPSHLRPGSSGEDSYQLAIREGKRTASASFLVTRLSASFSPTSGKLSKLKVRFRLLGWGKGGSLYLHYINPSGGVRLDRYLGPAGGSCGHLSTSRLRLFPFTPRKGQWMLQFDKRSSYQSSSVPRAAFRYKVS